VQWQVVPGDLAGRGASKTAVSVKIAGSCAPAQWVPQKYCFIQFYNMCAYRVRERGYGRDGCQTWGIYGVHGW
jgi:hypothetical protein